MRVAALIRVSSPGQAKEDKMSLPNQREVIERDCRNAGHEVVRWYEGVESATKGKMRGDKRRDILEKVLEDAAVQPSLWDGLMVYDSSRLSRDTEEGARVLRILKEHGKRFFAGAYETDLHNPDQVMSGEIQTAVAKAEAARLARRVRETKLKNALAKQWPVGELPWGRTLDATRTTFSLKPECVRQLQRIYKMIVERQHSLAEVAAKEGNTTQAWRKRIASAGDTVTLHLYGKAFTFNVPELLTEEQRRRIRQTWDANRTRGERSIGSEKTGNAAHHYALGGKVKCANCGSVMQGTYRNGKRWYVHVAKPIWKDDKCLRSIDAEHAERLTFGILGKVLSSRTRLRQAFAEGLDDTAQEAARLEAELKDTLRQRDKIGQQEQQLIDKINLTEFKDPKQKARYDERREKLGQDYDRADDRVKELQAAKAAVTMKGDVAERAARLLEFALGKHAKGSRPSFGMRSWRYEAKREVIDLLFGPGSLSQKRNLRFDLGLFFRKDLGEQTVVDIKTSVPLFDDATLRQLARQLDGKVDSNGTKVLSTLRNTHCRCR